MKKYHIALAGTFDVENYGDLMFPVIFERAMKARGLNFDLTLFSPSDAGTEALDDSRMVYSFKDFEKLNNKDHFDALIIGGGALIHLRSFMVRMPGEEEKEEYYNIHSWLSLIYLASRNQIKILFNLPQVPFEVPMELIPLVKFAIGQVDYLAVRDDFSKKYIENLYSGERKKEKIQVFPDTVGLVDDLFDYEGLKRIREGLLGFDDKYMVFHFQFTDGLEKSMYNELDKVVDDALRRGLRVVLLPIGYTHGDGQTMRLYSEHAKNKCFYFRDKIDIEEMTAVLSGAEYYVGMSFHGSLVSIAFGGMALTTNPSLKNRQLYNSYGISEFIVESYDDLVANIDLALLKKGNCTKKHNALKEKINKHFDNLYNYIVSGTGKKKEPEEFLDVIFRTISNYEFYIRKFNEIYYKLNDKDNEIEDLKKNIKLKDEKIKEVLNDIELIKGSEAFKLGSKIMRVPHAIKNRLRGRP